jgi:hypothetical protein
MRKEHDPLDISLHRRGFAAWEVWLDHVHLRRDEDIAKMRGVIDAYDSLALIMQIVILFSIALGGLVGGLTARRQWEARSHGVAMSVGVATVVVCLSVYFLYWWHKLRIAEEKLPSIRSRYENLKRKYGRLLWQL